MSNSIQDLQYAIDNGIIDFAQVQEQIEMKKRQELLAMHTYKIWEGKDGNWYTYLPDETKSRKIALKKRKSKRSIEDLVVEYWKNVREQTKTKTFRDVYFLWRKIHDRLVAPNTVAKYDSDYNRFFKNAEFFAIEIKSLQEDDIRIFMCETIQRSGLGKETARKLFGYIRDTIIYARKQKIIFDNPIEFLAAKDFYNYCTEKFVPVEKKIFMLSDMKKVQEQFAKDHMKKPNYIPTYAVEFASLTGMRVGEIAALRWDAITDDYIIVDKSEKSNRSKNEFYISKTKNGQNRLCPMTPAIRSLLDKVEKVEKEYGYFCEWVFADENGRIHAPVISSCSKTKCRQLGIHERGIHAYRKTTNSMLKHNGVSTSVAASILGHSCEVNERYYTFDVTDIKEKSRLLSEINNQVTLGNTNKCLSDSEKP